MVRKLWVYACEWMAVLVLTLRSGPEAPVPGRARPFPPSGGQGCLLGTDKNGSRPSRAFTGERALRSRSQLLFQNWNGPREPDC